jgi:crossover junction endodeoxyribonuclease RuvC
MYHSLIDLHKIKKPDERFAMMRQMIQSRIKTNNPDIVVIEDVVIQCSAQTALKLAQLQGAIMAVCDICGIKYEIIRPSEWRKELGFKQGHIKRDELKQQAIDYVLKNYGEEVSSDEADAICIALATSKKLNNNKLNQED